VKRVEKELKASEEQLATCEKELAGLHEEAKKFNKELEGESRSQAANLPAIKARISDIDREVREMQQLNKTTIDAINEVNKRIRAKV
jgi:archaellum component FlaC